MLLRASAAKPGASAAGEEDGWRVTVYYTAVEEHHRGAVRPVRGCRQLACASGDDDLDHLPGRFLEAPAFPREQLSPGASPRPCAIRAPSSRSGGQHDPAGYRHIAGETLACFHERALEVHGPTYERVTRIPTRTMRYDRGRQSLDRHATYIVATFVAGASR